jgi:16S rRNA processing protein RimM
MTEKFVIGLAGAPFGLKGFLKVHPCSGEIDHLLKLQSVVVSKDGRERLLQIEETSPAPPSVLMRFAGIDSPEAAKTLNGARLLAGREQAAPLGEGEFYIEDLKGLAVTTGNSETIGHITDIIEGGGGELAEIELSGGEKRLVPFRREFFSEICPEKGRLILQNLWILE